MLRLTNSLFLLFLLFACTNTDQSQVASPELNLPERPNILWLVAEDLGPYIPSFGDSTVQTPNLSRLAAEGICYDHVFSPSPVCAPSRAAIATGMYPTHIAANHMRTGPWYAANISDKAITEYAEMMPEGVFPYEAKPEAGVKMMSEVLREAGYYCTNNAKQDYQFRATKTAWDESSREAHWKNRAEGQPFFSIFNFEVTHESRIWAKAEDSLWIDENLDIPIPPYLPDTEVGKKDVRRMYSNIKEMDHQVGEILKQLEEDGLLDKTIIFWYTDHGGPLPRQKRLMYDSGLRVPMIIRFPEAQLAGSRDDQLISFIDFAPTVFSLTGIEPPAQLDGQAFLGQYKAENPRKYIHAAADRFDGLYDANRGVRDKQYKYIRYYEPEKPMLLQVKYREQMAIMQELHRLKEAGELTEAQAQWFRETKPEEELFDVNNDPHELNNLANDPAYKDKLEELKAECERWVNSFEDTGLMPETELLAKLWPDGKAPETASPEIEKSEYQLKITCSTPGASIGYKWVKEEAPEAWQVYKEAIPLQEGAKLQIIADRIGYKPSEVVEIDL
jgi:arylsulfatase A-like enzyme